MFQCVMKPTPAFVRVNATLRFVRLNAMVGLHLLLQTNFCLFFLGKTVDKLTVHRYNNRAALNGL